MAGRAQTSGEGSTPVPSPPPCFSIKSLIFLGLGHWKTSLPTPKPTHCRRSLAFRRGRWWTCEGRTWFGYRPLRLCATPVVVMVVARWRVCHHRQRGPLDVAERHRDRVLGRSRMAPLEEPEVAPQLLQRGDRARRTTRRAALRPQLGHCGSRGNRRKRTELPIALGDRVWDFSATQPQSSERQLRHQGGHVCFSQF